MLTQFWQTTLTMEMVRYFKDSFMRITELNMAWAKEKAKTRAEVGDNAGQRQGTGESTG